MRFKLADRRCSGIMLTDLALVFFVSAVALADIPSRSSLDETQRAGGAPTAQQGAVPSRSARTIGIWPLAFEPEAGRKAASTRFRSRGPGYSLFLDRGQATLLLGRRSTGGIGVPAARAAQPTPDHAGATVRLRLLGARPAGGTGLDPLRAKANYFTGSDSARWRTDLPMFGRVRYEGVYPGVDVVYYGSNGEIEHDFLVAPGADPRRIEIGFEGARAARLDERGDLILSVGDDEIRLRRPVAYQERSGARRDVAAAYDLKPGNRASFLLGEYDRGAALVIDPVISYSTYLGGSTAYDNGAAVAFDSAGFVYVMGTSPEFPTTPGAYDSSAVGITVFVAKMDTRATGAASLVYATFIDGSTAGGLAVDAQGNAYVSAGTRGGFPTTPGAYDTSHNGLLDIGIAKINPTGSALVWSTYLGGQWDDGGGALAVDLSGAVIVAGSTQSTNFPTTSSGYQKTLAAGYDGFISVLSPSGGALLYSTFFGGSGIDQLYGVALDGHGRVYVTGYTDSPDLPTTAGAFDRTLSGTSDGLVARFDPALTAAAALGWATYFGGSGSLDAGYGIALGPGNEPVVFGSTDSADLPGIGTGYDSTLGGSDDMYVARLSSDGSSATWVSYLGGGSSESPGASGLAVDAFGRAYVTGAGAGGYPSTPDAVTACGSGHAVHTVFDTSVSGSGALISSGCIGPAWGIGIAVDACGNSAITGFTTSTGYPTTAGAFDSSLSGRDAFLMQLAPSPGPNQADLAVTAGDSPDPLFVGEAVTFNLQVTNNGPNAASGVRLTHRSSAAITVGTLPPECSAEGSWVTCDLGTLASGASVPLTLTASAPAPGALWAIAQVSTAANDNDCSNNGATTVTTVKDATLNLDAPNGGEILPSGSSSTIEWSAPGAAATFNLDYSVTNGASWISIARGVGGRTYNWSAPVLRGNKPKSLVRIKAFNALGKSIGSDTSDAPFSIEVVKLDSPNSGESLGSGAVWPITWTTNQTAKSVAKVKLLYTINGGTTWKPIATLTGDPGTYSWTVPTVTASKTNCKVRVILQDSAAAGLGKDDSDVTFTMHP